MMGPRPRELADRTNVAAARAPPRDEKAAAKARRQRPNPAARRPQGPQGPPAGRAQRDGRRRARADDRASEEDREQPAFVRAIGEKLGQQGRSLGDAENEVLKMCFDSAIVCGAAGVEASAFDEAACKILEQTAGCDDAQVSGCLVQLCLESCARSERTSRAQAAQLHKLALMHERSMHRAEMARVKTVIDALWHAHSDEASVDMEVELFRFLNRKHAGDKARMAAEASQLVSSMARLAHRDAEIAIFFSIMRNEIDQGFWRVRTKLLQTVRELSAQGMGPREIVAHMYNDADAAELLGRLSARDEPALQEVLLRFHLERHATLIAPVRQAYASLDAADRKEVSFSDYVRAALLPAKSHETADLD